MRRILRFLTGNRGRHAACQGHHWHMKMNGWRCCGCSGSQPAGDRPADAEGVACRWRGNEGPRPEWLQDIIGPGEATQVYTVDRADGTAMPINGRRRLVDGAGERIAAIAKVPKTSRWPATVVLPDSVIGSVSGTVWRAGGLRRRPRRV